MKNQNNSSLIMPILFIIIGIIFCIPSATGTIFSIALTVLSVLILIGSIMALVKGCQCHDDSRNSQIITGIIGICVAIIFPILAWTLFIVFEIVFGVLLVAYGAYSILVALMSKHMLSTKITVTIVSVIIVTVGALLIAHAVNGNPTISYIIGGVLIFDGVIGLVSGIINSKNEAKATKEQEANVIDAEVVEDNTDAQ